MGIRSPYNKVKKPGTWAHAHANDIQTYTGVPCTTCGGTQRRTSNKDCINRCRRQGEYEARRARAGKSAYGWREARGRGDETYCGSPCSICGGTERVTKGGKCVACRDERKRFMEERTMSAPIYKPRVDPEQAWQKMNPDFNADNLQIRNL